MRNVRSVASFALAAALVASAAEARAGGYVAGGIGTGASLGGSLSKNFDTSENDTARFGLGHRTGPIGIELSYAGAGMAGTSPLTTRQDWTSRTLAIDLKGYVGLVGDLETYGKLGLSKTWLDAPDGVAHSYDGRGWELGVGLEYGVDFVTAGAALWLDFTHLRSELRDGDKPDLDGSTSIVSLGLSIGF